MSEWCEWTPIAATGGKTETDRFTVDDAALLWFLRLDPAEREALDTAIAPLVDRPEEDWPATGAIRLTLPQEARLAAFVDATKAGG